MNDNLVEMSAAAAQSLSQTAYQYLLAKLRQSAWSHTEKIAEAAIAAQLGVSRVPIRQALLQLVSEGYLVSTARGYMIPKLSAEDIAHVFELRLLLEPRAAALAAQAIAQAQIAQLDQAIAEAEAGHAQDDLPRVFAASLKFRETWLSAVGNTRLAATITRYADQVLLVRHATLRDMPRRRNVIAGFEELRNAFARHDVLKAQDAMLRFVLAAERDFMELSEPPAQRSDPL